MTNNSTASEIRAALLISQRRSLAAAHSDAGSYRKLADILGVKHHSYIANFVKDGTLPNIKAQKAMGIYQPSKGQERYETESQKAKAKGWTGISEFLTAVRNDKIELPEKVDWIA